MLRYLVHRVALSLVVLFGLAVATFLIIHLIPGNPIRQSLGPGATQEQIDAISEDVGLDRPLPEQFGAYLGGAVTGDFGESLVQRGESVGGLVRDRVTPSAILIGYGLLIAIAIGMPLALVAAVRPNGLVDNGVRLVATFSFAMPLFWLALILSLVLGLQLGWFPVSGYEPGLSGVLKTLTLPALTLGLALTVVVVRTLRSSLLEVLQSDYIDAARARGLSERRIVGKHALRNAIMPTITILAINVGFLIGGTVVIEQIFRIPGLGTLLVDVVQRRDYAVVQGLVLLAGATVVAVSLAADLLQALIDPRVRLARR